MSNKSVVIIILGVFLSFQSLQFAAENPFKIVSSDISGIVVEYSPRFDYFENVDGGYEYGVHDAALPGDDEFPALYVIPFSVGVPSFGGLVEILNVDYSVVKGKLKTVGQNKKQSREFDKWVTQARKGISRGLRIETYFIYPVLYSERNGEILRLKKITFRIRFGKQSGKYETKNEKILDAVVNGKIAKRWFIKREKSKAVVNSVLASGTWYRANIEKEGIYKVDYDMLTAMGFDPETDDPRTVKIYNNGGTVQPEKDNDLRYNDLVENPIYFFGEEDGKLDRNDFLIFYGHGTSFFRYDEVYLRVRYYHHPFSRENYYWITWSGENGKRMEKIPYFDDPNAETINYTDAYFAHETDKFNPMKTGRLFLGEEVNYSRNSLSFTISEESGITFPLASTSPISFFYRFATLSPDGFVMNIDFNGERIETRSLSGYGNSQYTFGNIYDKEIEFLPSSEITDPTVKFSFSINTNSQRGALDYFTLRYRNELAFRNDPLVFYSPDTTSTVKYSIAKTNDDAYYVLNVGDFQNIKMLETVENNGNVYFTANETFGHVSKYIAAEKSLLKNPTFEKVENQNIHGREANAQLIVIANKKFAAQAQRFVEYKNNESPNAISTALFYTDEIYNEFSCGAENDPVAIRDFIMYAYKNWDVPPEYVLLFGKGTYDYFDTEEMHNNYVPTYQSADRTLYEVGSYVTDDFFGWLDGGDNLLDVAVGRFSVESLDDAENIVDKVIEYENNADFSEWRRTATFVADDGITSHSDEHDLHTRDCENLTKVFPEYFNKNKIYLIFYPTEITGAGRRKPSVNKAIIDAFNNGTAIMHFHGHGNPDVWTHEQVFVKDITIPQLTNKNFSFLTVAACDFGRSDYPARTCGAEMLISKRDGGTIGTLSAERPTYPGENYVFVRDFYRNLLSHSDDGKPRRTGDAVLYGKLRNSGINTRKYVLLGDPTLRLKLPELEAKVDSVNGETLDNPVQIKALSDVKIDGSLNGNNLNGEATVTVYDAKRYVTVTEPGWRNLQVEFSGAVLYRGRASVESGKFGTRFVVPKDISYESENGKIVAYVYNDEVDGVGFTDNIFVNGIEERENDGAGPEIEIAFDDFDSHGNLVNTNFSFLARLSDETGINTSGAGIGHTLEGIIDGDLEHPVDFTNGFVGDVDAGGTSGEIKYNFYNFEPGEHTIKIKAWDVFNNPSEKEAEFTVVEGDGLVVRNIVNYPNPFSNSTYFTFQHNLSEPIDVQINVYTVYGRKIREIKKFGIIDRFVKIYWDGRDEDGGALANGTYLYKLIITTQSGEYSESFLGKLSVVK